MTSCPLAAVSDVVNIDQKGKAFGAPKYQERRPSKGQESLAIPGALDHLDASLSRVCVSNLGRSSPILIKQLRPEGGQPPLKDHYGAAFMASYQARRMERHPSGGTSFPTSCAPSSYQPNVLDSFGYSRNTSPIFGAQGSSDVEGCPDIDEMIRAAPFGEAEEGEEFFPWSDDEDVERSVATTASKTICEPAYKPVSVKSPQMSSPRGRARELAHAPRLQGGNQPKEQQHAQKG